MNIGEDIRLPNKYYKLSLIILCLTFSFVLKANVCKRDIRSHTTKEFNSLIVNDALLYCGPFAPYLGLTDDLYLGDPETYLKSISKSCSKIQKILKSENRKLIDEGEISEASAGEDSAISNDRLYNPSTKPDESESSVTEAEGAYLSKFAKNKGLDSNFHKIIFGHAFSKYIHKVYSCNRLRDTKTIAINRRVKRLENGLLKRSFPSNLRERKITGKLSYFGIMPLDYGYSLRRDNGFWTLKTAILLDWVNLTWKKDYLDINEDLATILDIWNKKNYCGEKVYRKGKKKKNKNIIRGKVSNEDGVLTCRLKRTTKVRHPISGKIKKIEYWYKHYFKEVVEAYWSRPDFKVEVKMIEKRVANWDDYYNNIWVLHLSIDPDVRPRYHQVGLAIGAAAGAIVGGLPGAIAGGAIGNVSDRHFYTGMPTATIAHEFGHWLGLDDEYSEKKDPPYKCHSSKNKKDVRNGNARNNIMCSKTYAYEPLCLKGENVHLGECDNEEVVSEYKKALKKKFGRGNNDFKKQIDNTNYYNVGQASFYYTILKRRYPIGKRIISNKKEAQDHPVVDVKYCSKRFKTKMKSAQGRSYCYGAHIAYCGRNIPKERDANCSLIKSLPNGKKMIKKCGACDDAKAFKGNTEAEKTSEKLDESPEFILPSDIDSSEGRDTCTEPDCIEGDIVLPDIYEYPE